MRLKLNKADQAKLMDAVDRFRSVAGGYTNGTNGQEIVEAWDYYYGRKPSAYCEGGSKYVSRDVWEAVNGTLQDLTTVFCANQDAVHFTPRNRDDSLAAKAATAYVNQTIQNHNDGYSVLHDALKEALVTKHGYVKRWWKEQIDTEEEEFKRVTQQELEMLMQNEEYSMDEPEQHDDGTFSGTLYKTVDNSHVAIEFTPYEEVLVDPDARSLKDSVYFGHRRDYVAQELIDMGFNREEVLKGTYEASVAIDMNEIRIARNPEERDFYALGTNIVGDTETERVWLHEEFIMTSIGKKGKNKDKPRYLQVFSVGKVLLDVAEIDEIPFEMFTPFPTPGSMWGESVYDITRDIQDVKTALTRGYIDNIMNANYGRFTAVKGQYDRKSLLHNVPGGVVETNAPGMIDRFPYHALPQGTDQLLETFEQTKERRTGVTRTSMGLNADIFKNDNAYATVDMMMGAAQSRIRMVARNMAEDGFKSLYKSIYRIAREHEKKAVTLEVQGKEVQINPHMWPERFTLKTAVAIGVNERKERTTNLTNLLNVLSQNPMIAGQSFQPTNANHLAKELTESLGFYDVDNYVTSVENIPQPQPDPMEAQVKQLELQKMQLEIAKTQAETQEIQVKAQLEAARIQLQKMQTQKELAELQFTQEKAADDMRVRQEDSASGTSDRAISAARENTKIEMEARKISIEEKRLALESQNLTANVELKKRELDIKEKEILLEAQLEAAQDRQVGLGH